MKHSCNYWQVSKVVSKALFLAGILNRFLGFAYLLAASLYSMLVSRVLKQAKKSYTHLIMFFALCKFHHCKFHYCDFSKKSINLPNAEYLLMQIYGYFYQYYFWLMGLQLMWIFSRNKSRNRQELSLLDKWIPKISKNMFDCHKLLQLPKQSRYWMGLVW